MTTNNSAPTTPKWTERLIASFGRARLVLRFSGGYELRGGTRNDRLEAREWTSLFAHEAAVAVEGVNSAAPADVVSRSRHSTPVHDYEFPRRRGHDLAVG